MAQESTRHSSETPPGEGRMDLDALRERIGALERLGSGRDGRAGVMPLGLPALDAHLPWRGLPRGCLHEIVAAEGDGAGPAFAAYLLARLAAFGPVLWLSPRPDAYLLQSVSIDIATARRSFSAGCLLEDAWEYRCRQ